MGKLKLDVCVEACLYICDGVTTKTCGSVDGMGIFRCLVGEGKVFGGVKQDVSFVVLFAVLTQMEAVEGFWNASNYFKE